MSHPRPTVELLFGYGYRRSLDSHRPTCTEHTLLFELPCRLQIVRRFYSQTLLVRSVNQINDRVPFLWFGRLEFQWLALLCLTAYVLFSIESFMCT